MKEKNKNISILIVDDIANMRRTIRNMLKYLGYSKFYEAENGKKALLKLKLHKIDLIISDWNMPIMNGIELLKEVKKHPQWKFIPFIIITGETDKSIIAEAAEYGADEYMIKPFVVKTLETKIENVFSNKNNPDSPVYHYELGEKYLIEGKYKEAFEEFKKALKLDYKFLKAFGGMAKVLMKKGKLKEAEEVLNEALKINPNYIEGNQLLGEIYLQMNKDDKALEYLKKAYNLNPKNTERTLKIGDIHVKRNEIEEAEKYFENALKYEKDKANALIKISDILLKYGKYEKAENILSDLTEEYPDMLIAYNRLGIALRKQGKFGEALAAYNKALIYYDKDPNIYYNIGRTYFEMKKYDDARKYFNKALELKPDFKEAEEALKLLDKIT